MFETSLVANRSGLKSPWAYPLTAGLYLGTFLIAWSVSFVAIKPGPPPEGWDEIRFIFTNPVPSDLKGYGGGGGGGGKTVARKESIKTAELTQPKTISEFVPPTEPVTPVQDNDAIDDPVGDPNIPGFPPGPGIGPYSSGPGGGGGSRWGPRDGDLPRGYPPSAELPREITSAMQKPVLMVRVEPEYPELARRIRQQGLVVLKAVINEHGEVEDLRVTQSVPLLDDAAVVAVRQWKYSPAMLDGRPVRVFFEVRVRFALN